MSGRPTLEQMILHVWKAGAPSQPGKEDDLRRWINSYFPRAGGGEWKAESIGRIARRLRAESVGECNYSTKDTGL